MARAWVMTSSDASAGHPRRYGTFPAKFANFVRANPVMDIATFVHRSSGLTAETFGLNDRGFVRTGYAADLVVLDPETYRSRADYLSPEGLAEGVRIVVVNGRLAVEDGAPTGNLAGRPLRHAPPRGSCP
jgi:N-acyl-D-aspartate/D-glutamate deacylase